MLPDNSSACLISVEEELGEGDDGAAGVVAEAGS
jgi:hypothetical protein